MKDLGNRASRVIALSAIAISLGACAQIQPSASAHAGAAQVQPDDYEGTKFDGSYVGMPRSTSGSCNDSQREVVLVVKRSLARLVWQMREGRELRGEVSPDGVVDMHSQGETYLVDLKGRIVGDTLTATTTGTSNHGDCTYAMTFEKRDLSKTN